MSESRRVDRQSLRGLLAITGRRRRSGRPDIHWSGRRCNELLWSFRHACFCLTFPMLEQTISLVSERCLRKTSIPLFFVCGHQCPHQHGAARAHCFKSAWLCCLQIFLSMGTWCDKLHFNRMQNSQASMHLQRFCCRCSDRKASPQPPRIRSLKALSIAMAASVTNDAIAVWQLGIIAPERCCCQCTSAGRHY